MSLLVSGKTDCRKCKRFYKVKPNSPIPGIVFFGNCSIEKNDLLFESSEDGSFQHANCEICPDYLYNRDYESNVSIEMNKEKINIKLKEIKKLIKNNT
jgi:hypothetical protein